MAEPSAKVIRLFPGPQTAGQPGAIFFDLSSLMEKPLQPSFENPLALKPPENSKSVDCGDRFDNITFICKDEKQVSVDRAVFCRVSDVLFKALSDPSIAVFDMREFHKDTLVGLNKVLTFRCGFDSLVETCVCKKIEEDCGIYQLLKFAKKFEVGWFLSTFIEVLIKRSTIRQIFFDWDRHFNLGIRKHLLWEIYNELDSPLEHVFTDPLIYKEIGNFIFKVPIDSNQKSLLRNKQRNFVLNVIKSKIPFEEINTDLTGAPVTLAILLLQTVKNEPFAYLSYWLSNEKLINDDVDFRDLRGKIFQKSVESIKKAHARFLEEKIKSVQETPVKKTKFEEKDSVEKKE